MDFTIKSYNRFLTTLINAGYSFQPFAEFLERPEKKVIMLRHDVDAKKQNSFRFAEIQNRLGICGTYYFRMVPQSFDEEVIRKIAAMGHEVGYHYEDMDFAGSRFKVQGLRLVEETLIDEAIKIFEENLMKLRQLVTIKTICMHGSPRSPFDNKAVWKKYDYRDFGITGEPYFDIDFNEVFYLTDTGRMWDGEKVSVRDKVQGSRFKVQGYAGVISNQQPETTLRQAQGYARGTRGQEPATSNKQPAATNNFPHFHSTSQIITSAEKGVLPDRIMFTFHPQRWTDNPAEWLWELGFQNLKNVVKRVVVKRQGNNHV
jgi:hypothetical protein